MARRPTPAPVTGRTAEAQAFRNERVLAAAEELARAGGYEAVQMREVAQLSKVALATLYKYYPSKDDLIAGLVRQQVIALDADVRVRPPRERTPSGRLGTILIRAFHALVRNPGYAHAFVSVYLRPVPFEQRPTTQDAGVFSTQLGRGSRFLDVLIAAAWGPDAKVSADQRRALQLADSIWNGLVIGWINGYVSQEEVEKRLRLAARLLVSES